MPSTVSGPKVVDASIEAVSPTFAPSRNEPVHALIGPPLIEQPSVVLQVTFLSLVTHPVAAVAILTPNCGPASSGGK